MPNVTCAVAQISPNVCGPGAEYFFSPEIDSSVLAPFVEHGYSSTVTRTLGPDLSQFINTGVKIAFAHTGNMSSLGLQLVEVLAVSFWHL